MKKTVIIATYFGELPYYHSLWEKSAWANPEINWLVFTDQKTKTSNPELTHAKFCDWQFVNAPNAPKTILLT